MVNKRKGTDVEDDTTLVPSRCMNVIFDIRGRCTGVFVYIASLCTA